MNRLLTLFLPGVICALSSDAPPKADSEQITSPIQPLIAPASIGPVNQKQTAAPPSVNWDGLLRQSGWFLAMQHGFRLATEHDTRHAEGPLLRGYVDSVRNLHGWSDGDPAYVNYVGHPMQGATAGFIWVHNDRKFSGVAFSTDPRYWKSRLRAAGFSWAYSTQFEIGPVSEASIGYIQSRYPQQGLVDQVITPTLGLGWMIAEDAVDRFLLIPLERRVRNVYVRTLARGFLNPTRSMANIVRGKAPFVRDDRSIFGMPADHAPAVAGGLFGTADEIPDNGPAPVQFTAFSKHRIVTGSLSCATAGGAEAAVRIARQWQLVFEVAGCDLSGLSHNTSGDSLSYMFGPRWSPSGRRLQPYFQFLLGGRKLTTEQVSPETRRALEIAAQQNGLAPPDRDEYTTSTVSNGFAMSTGAGIDLKIARAAALKLASIEYNRSWLGTMNGAEDNKGLELKIGVTLRVGTW